MLKNGDKNENDLQKETIDLKISKKQFLSRLNKTKTIKNRYISGALAKYATLVQSASEGAITKPIIKYMKKVPN
jgi:dihydroxy-acid dehydratase